MKNQEVKMNFDLKATTGLNTESGSPVWQEGVILRKVSKFIAGTPEDAIVPIPVFFDPQTGKMLEGMVPKDLREEYADYII
jgi:hypothetical protein